MKFLVETYGDKLWEVHVIPESEVHELCENLDEVKKFILRILVERR